MAGWSLRANGAVAGRLPGWGILLGGFRTAAPTRVLLDSSLRALPPNLRVGHADVFTRQMEGTQVYRAAIIGLTGGQAAAACQALNSGGAILPRTAAGRAQQSAGCLVLNWSDSSGCLLSAAVARSPDTGDAK